MHCRQRAEYLAVTIRWTVMERHRFHDWVAQPPEAQQVGSDIRMSGLQILTLGFPELNTSFLRRLEYDVVSCQEIGRKHQHPHVMEQSRCVCLVDHQCRGLFRLRNRTSDRAGLRARLPQLADVEL